MKRLLNLHNELKPTYVTTEALWTFPGEFSGNVLLSLYLLLICVAFQFIMHT